MIVTFRPVTLHPADWLPAARERPTSPFASTYSDTMLLLDRELHAIKAKSPTIALVGNAQAFRADGQLRGDARIDHPGVIVSFDTKVHGTLTYPCDRFGTSYRVRGPAWHQNLRAVALGLEALRRVERYGIAERGQQYAGYRELGAGTPMGPVTMTVEEAGRLLWNAAYAGDLHWTDSVHTSTEIRKAWHAAAARLHPDAGGSSALFDQATKARDLLLEQFL